MRKLERKGLNEVVTGIQDALDIAPAWFASWWLTPHQGELNVPGALRQGCYHSFPIPLCVGWGESVAQMLWDK